MRALMRLAAFATLAVFAAAAQDKPCSPADAAKAEKAVDRVVNWDSLYKAWQEYGHCDKGAVDEVFTDALMRCIVEWKNIEELSRAMEKDPRYREFVHRHLNSPAAKPDLDNIYARAKRSCPKGLEAFCSDIAMTVKPLGGFEPIPTAPDPAAPVAPKK